MTFGELKTALNAIGGQSTDLSEVFEGIDDPNVGSPKYCDIVTRAMGEINSLRPRVAETVLHCQSPRVVYASPDTKSEESMTVPLTGGKAVTFEARGVGAYSYGGKTYEIRTPYRFERFRFLLSEGDGDSMTIEATNMLSVRNLAVYSETVSDSETDIPSYAKRAEYEVEEPDFVSLSPDSIDLDVVEGYGIKIRDNRVISIPWGITVDIPIKYNRRLKPVTVGTKDTDEIDLDDDLAMQLLPNLVASYAYFDPTDSSSLVYRQIYENDRAMVLSKLRNADNARVISTNNW